MRLGRAGRFAGLWLLALIVGLSTPNAASPQSRGVSPDGTTELHLAVNGEDIDAVDRLLRAGADVHATTRYGVTPIWLAASNGSAAMIERLLQSGADARTTNAENGETVLMMAARSGRADAVTLLLAHGADVSVAERIRDQTALMWAAAQQHPAVVRLLLDQGADVNARSRTGLTPLLFAIRAGDIESAGLLIDAGASLTDTHPDGTTPLVLAILNARYELAALLLDRGADPNGPDPHGSPLHVLAWIRRASDQGLPQAMARVPSGNLDSIELAKKLLARGADVNARIDWEDRPRPGILGSTSASGITIPKDLAITRNHFVTLVGATPFYLAAFQGDPDLMRLLVAHGADPMIPTRQRVTPLLAAAGVGHNQSAHPNDDHDILEAVKLAYELGNDVRGTSDFSEYDHTGDWRWNHANALHGAAARGNLALIRWLADKGVSFEDKTEAGWLPIHAAEGIWMYGFIQHQFAAATLIRELMAERGLPRPRSRTEAEIQDDGLSRTPVTPQAVLAPPRTRSSEH